MERVERLSGWTVNGLMEAMREVDELRGWLQAKRGSAGAQMVGAVWHDFEEELGNAFVDAAEAISTKRSSSDA